MAFSNGTVAVFLIGDSPGEALLVPGRVFNLGATLSGMTVGSLMIRSVVATPTEIVVGMYSGVHSLVVVDVWRSMEKHEPEAIN